MDVKLTYLGLYTVASRSILRAEKYSMSLGNDAPVHDACQSYCEKGPHVSHISLAVFPVFTPVEWRFSKHQQPESTKKTMHYCIFNIYIGTSR